MNYTRVHKKSDTMTGSRLGFAFSCAAFFLGAMIAVLFRQYTFSIVLLNSAELWLACALVLFADAASVLMRSAAFLSVLYSVFGGFFAGCAACLNSETELFSLRFAVFCAALYVYCFALIFVSSRIFSISAKLKQLISIDRRVSAAAVGLGAGLMGLTLLIAVLLSVLYIMPP